MFLRPFVYQGCIFGTDNVSNMLNNLELCSPIVGLSMYVSKTAVNSYTEMLCLFAALVGVRTNLQQAFANYAGKQGLGLRIAEYPGPWSVSSSVCVFELTVVLDGSPYCEYWPRS